jgi:hypothetical protein
MCHGHEHGHRRRGFGFGRRGFPNREEWLERLERYQQHLEEQQANVADIIRRLKEDKPETASV